MTTLSDIRKAMLKTKLIIFDLDGTLVDTSVDICNAINYAVEPLNVQPVSIEETKFLVGEGITKLFEKLLLQKNKNSSCVELVERFSEYYSAHLIDFSVPYAGAVETLESLSGFRKAVVSNKRESFTLRIMNELNLSRFFEVIVGGDTVSSKKPSPEPLNYVLSKLRILPDEAVIVGDSNYDIDAGKDAGMGTVGVTYGFRSIDYLQDADFIIDSIVELNSLGLLTK
ncbi:MAG: HAD-IA family hydrolase [Nitrospirae bacterium]|nr:HAD-IA family hydrolase [Nitrospirota bacterium]